MTVARRYSIVCESASDVARLLSVSRSNGCGSVGQGGGAGGGQRAGAQPGAGRGPRAAPTGSSRRRGSRRS